jgi:hypothetical protein
VVSPAICRPTTAHCFCDGISSEATDLIIKSTIPQVDQQQEHALAQNPAGPRVDPILCCSFLTLPGVLCQNLVFPDRQKITGWRFHYCDTGAERYVSFVTLRANRSIYAIASLTFLSQCLSREMWLLAFRIVCFYCNINGYIIRPIVYHDSDR